MFVKRVHWLLSLDPTTAVTIVKIKLPTIAATANPANTFKRKTLFKIHANITSIIIYFYHLVKLKHSVKFISIICIYERLTDIYKIM